VLTDDGGGVECLRTEPVKATIETPILVIGREDSGAAAHG
jgi:hypothetical protein